MYTSCHENTARLQLVEHEIGHVIGTSSGTTFVVDFGGKLRHHIVERGGLGQEVRDFGFRRLEVLRHNILLISLAASTGGTAVNDQRQRFTHGDFSHAGSSTALSASLITGQRPPSPHRPETR
jgi:hypothetical protein